MPTIRGYNNGVPFTPEATDAFPVDRIGVGTGFELVGSIFNPLTPGTYTNTTVVVSAAGLITSITSGGATWPPPINNLPMGMGSGATVTVAFNGGGTQVVGLTITNGGSNYPAGTQIAIIDGAGGVAVALAPTITAGVLTAVGPITNLSDFSSEDVIQGIGWQIGENLSAEDEVLYEIYIFSLSQATAPNNSDANTYCVCTPIDDARNYVFVFPGDAASNCPVGTDIQVLIVAADSDSDINLFIGTDTTSMVCWAGGNVVGVISGSAFVGSNSTVKLVDGDGGDQISGPLYMHFVKIAADTWGGAITGGTQ